MYSIKSLKDEKKRAKGVFTRIVRKKLSHQNYVDCLKKLETITEELIRIGSDKHEIFTIRQKKIALNPFDDKRYILSDGITSLPHGHFKLTNLYQDND